MKCGLPRPGSSVAVRAAGGSLLAVVASLAIVAWARPAGAYTKPTHLELGREAAMALPDTELKDEILFFLGDTANCSGDVENGTRILEGIWEEDCNFHPRNHFWDADNNRGLLGFESAYDRAIRQFNLAVEAYVVNDKDRAYYLLGRVAHLLQDMAQPAHQHLDLHGEFDPEDNYEPGVESITSDYTYDSPTGTMSLSLIDFLGGYPLTPIDQFNLPHDFRDVPDYGSSLIRRLFVHQGEATDFFESEDRSQDTDYVYYDIDAGDFVSGFDFDDLVLHGTSVPPPDEPDEFSDAEIRAHADVLLPLSIRYVSALYELFWMVVHAGGQSLLDLAMTASPNPARPGEVVTYAMTVTNRGAEDVAGVELRQQLPEHMENFSEDGTGGDCPNSTCSSGENILFSLGTLPAGASRTVVLGVIVAQGFDEPAEGDLLQSGAWVTDATGREVAAFSLVAADPTPDLALGIHEDRDPMAPGEILEYTLTYANAGEIALFDVELRVTIPAGGVFVSANAGGTLAGDSVEWDLGTLDVSESGYRTLRVMADAGLVGGEILTAVATVTDASGSSAEATASTAIATSPALGLAMTVAPDPVRPGEILAYTMEVVNRGGVDLAGVELRQQLPGYIENFSESGTGGECPLSTCSLSESIVFSLGTLPAGESRFIVLGPIVATGFNQPDDNSLVVSSATVTESGGTGAAATAVTVAHGAPRLTLGLSEDRDPVAPGELVAYSLTFANSGPIALFDAELEVTLPVGATFVSASHGGTAAGGTVTWDLATFEVGESGHRVMRVLVDGAAADGAILSSTAIVRGGSRSARAGAATAVDSSPGLALGLVAAPDPARPGQIASHALTVANRGAGDLAGVSLRLILPSHIENFAEDGTGGECPLSTCSIGESIVYSLGTLSAGRSRTIVVGPEIAVGFDEPVDNTLIVSTAAVEESGGTSATATATLLTHSAPSLAVAITDGPDPVRPGGGLTYSLTYANSGPIALFGGSLQATLPAGTSFVSATHGATVTGATVEWDLGTLSVSESDQRTLHVEPTGALASGTLLEVTAIVSDDGRRGARAAAVTAVDASPSLELSMSAGPDLIEPGQVLTYAMTTTNPGPDPLAGVELRQVLPSHIENFSETGTGGECPNSTCSSGETIVFDLGTLLAGQSRLVTLDTTVAVGFDEPEDNAVILSVASANAATGSGSSASSAIVVDASGLPPTCSVPDHLTISDRDILTATELRACASITAGPAVRVFAPLSLRAERVVITGGVSVEGTGTLVVADESQD